MGQRSVRINKDVIDCFHYFWKMDACSPCALRARKYMVWDIAYAVSKTCVHELRLDVRFDRSLCSRPNWWMPNFAWEWPYTQFSVVRSLHKWGPLCSVRKACIQALRIQQNTFPRLLLTQMPRYLLRLNSSPLLYIGDISPPIPGVRKATSL